ncbi:MAG: glycosyltransferase family 39 protein, partial [Planctomycetes bacterium]|nr:glycosyltransferase family 39 protein [Planctomycetota bacterium]
MNIKGRRRTMLCVVAVALGLRLGYLLETRELPTVRHLVGDASGYHEWAGRIADGAWLGSEPFYQAPLYPYALAVVFKVFGDQVWMVRIVQAIWGAAAVGLLVLGAARMFGHRAGILAGIMLALYAPALFFDGIVQKTSLGCVLMCATMAVMATAQTWKRRAMPALLLGVLVALLSLVRENALAWIPIIGLWVAVTWRGAQGWGRAIAVYGIGVGIILLPIGVRNAVVSGEWSITTFQAGP